MLRLILGCFPHRKNIDTGPSRRDKGEQYRRWIVEVWNRNMTEKSAKSKLESEATEEENTLPVSLATSERSLRNYFNDNTDVPGQNRLLTIKNRRRSMRANLTKKINTIDEYLKSRKSRKLVELAVTQLSSYDSYDKELQDADTWLIESQAVVEEVICKTFEYQEFKIDGSESNAPIVFKESQQIDPAGSNSVTNIGFQSSKKVVVK